MTAEMKVRIEIPIELESEERVQSAMTNAADLEESILMIDSIRKNPSLFYTEKEQMDEIERTCIHNGIEPPLQISDLALKRAELVSLFNAEITYAECDIDEIHPRTMELLENL